MSDEEKMKFMTEILGRGNVHIGNMFWDNHATLYINNGRCEESAPARKTEVPTCPKSDIIDYIDRLKPIVKQEYLSQYDKIWNGLLELREVKMQVYNKGKQQDTTFNRNLVAQIIYQIKEKIYVPTANTVTMAECLEPEKGVSHPVRQKLGEMPDRCIKKSIEEYIKEFI